MATICPKDGTPCIDDVCRGCGICAVTRTELMDQCSRCYQVYSHEYGIACSCEREADDSYEDDEG